MLGLMSLYCFFRMFLYEFNFKHRVGDPDKVMTNLGLWLKCKTQLDSEFPKLEESIYYRELSYYGMKGYWRDEWLEKVQSMPSGSELSIEGQRKLAAIMLYVLWQLWSKVTAGKEMETSLLITISLALDRFCANHWVAVGFGCLRNSPPSFTGQIDILDSESYPKDTTQWIRKWVNKYI